MRNKLWLRSLHDGFFVSFLSFISLLFVTLSSSVNAVEFAAIEQNIERAMKTFDVPGAAVAIVKDDQLVFAKGFGVIEQGKEAKVDAKTLFGIASNTKAFTAAALAILVDEGKLNWNDKVITHLPNFQMYDAYVTQQMTVYDLLSHRSGLGLGAGDLMIWPATDISNDEIMAKIRYIEPASSFRSKYAYNNIMYVVAGELVAKVSGMPWQQFVQTKILTPLQMSDTRMAYSLIEQSNRNVAIPHGPVDGKLQPVGGDFLEKFSSAGSMASNVTDMSKWLRLQLRKGLLLSKGGNEQRVFSDEQHFQMWSAHTVQEVPQSFRDYFDSHFRAYGLGWGLNDYHGLKMVGHTGGILGMVSKVVLMPQHQLGVVILTNQQSGHAFNAIAYDIVDRFIGRQVSDWVDIYQKRLNDSKKEKKIEQSSFKRDRHKNTKPSLPLEQYVGLYQDHWYGDVEVKLVKGQLQLRFARTKLLIGDLEHYHHDTFVVRWHDRSLNADAFVSFSLDSHGAIADVRMKAVMTSTDFSFDFHDLKLIPKG